MNIEEFNNEFLQFKDTTYRYAVALLHDSSAAEDATQDLYEKLWRRRLFIRRGRFKSLLLVSIRNICLDVLRHRSRGRERIAAESTSIAFDDDSAKDDSTESMGDAPKRLRGAGVR